MLPTDCMTVTLLVADALPDRAVMVAVPFFTAVTRPCVLTVATPAALLVQVTTGPAIDWPFRSRTVAVSWTVSPNAISVAEVGSMAMLPTDSVTVTVILAEAFPDRPVIVAVPFFKAVTRP